MVVSEYSKRKFAIGVIYRPGDYSLIQFVGELEETFADLIVEHGRIVCCGDFNVNFLNSNDPGTLKMHNILKSFNLIQAVTAPTHDRRLIDLMILSEDLAFDDCSVVATPEIDDHDLVILRLATPGHASKPIYMNTRVFKNFNTEALLRDLQEIPFHIIYYTDDIDEKLQLFNFYLTSLFDLHAPFERIKITKPSAPWLTYNIKKLMALRDKAALKYKKHA